MVSSQTGFNHHVRYVLPLSPFVFIWISKVGRAFVFGHRRLAAVVVAAVAWSVGSSIWVYPHTLSYFNELAGGPRNGHAHLGGVDADSNIDWGQDLLYLKRWLEKRYVSYFEGDKIRYDREFERGGETSHQQQVFGDDVLIRAFPDDGETHLFGSTTRPAKAYLPDPRRLGVVNWSYDTIAHKGYEDFFLNPNRDQFKVEAGTQAGELIWKVSFQFQGRDEPLYGKYWLSRDKAGLPVYIEIRSGEGEEEHLRSITTELKKYGHDDVWFPREVIFRIKREGRVVREEVATVEDAVFGDGVAKETFALAGLGLPKGAPVNADGEILFWNGDQLVPRTYHPTELEQPPQATGARLWLAVISGLLALIAAALLGYRRLRIG